MISTKATLAEAAKASFESAVKSPSGHRFVGYFGTAPNSPCVHTINGGGYEVARFRDNSAIAVLLGCGSVYGIAENPPDSTLDIWSKVGRLMTRLSGPERAQQASEVGTLLAVGDGGRRWYRIGETVWLVNSATECDFHCLWHDWERPDDARTPTLQHAYAS